MLLVTYNKRKGKIRKLAASQRKSDIGKRFNQRFPNGKLYSKSQMSVYHSVIILFYQFNRPYLYVKNVSYVFVQIFICAI